MPSGSYRQPEREHHPHSRLQVAVCISLLGVLAQSPSQLSVQLLSVHIQLQCLSAVASTCTSDLFVCLPHFCRGFVLRHLGQCSCLGHICSVFRPHMDAGVEPQQAGLVDSGYSVDERWCRLLATASLLAERLPPFAAMAASSRWVQQILQSPPGESDSEDELLLRAFCRTVQHCVASNREDLSALPSR